MKSGESSSTISPLAQRLEASYENPSSSSHEHSQPLVPSSSSLHQHEPDPDVPKKSHESSKSSQPKASLHPRRKSFEVFMAFFLIALFIFMFVLAASTNSSPFIVLVAFLPTLFTVFFAMFIYEAHPDNRHVLWPLPLVVMLVFYVLAVEFGGSFISGLDIDTLSGLNIFASYLYIIINYVLLHNLSKKSSSALKVIVKEAPPTDISEFIASIEDKSKALNFVIGRVYNSYHGGTKDLREKINMKQEWYDQFSKVPSNPEAIDFSALSKLLTVIELRLKKLEKSEKEVFGPDHVHFKNLVRSSDGSDKVIDVLDKNDKDPVKSYYEGALQFVQKIRDFMAHQKVPEVVNEYVHREEQKTPAPRSSKWHKLKKVLK